MRDMPGATRRRGARFAPGPARLPQPRNGAMLLRHAEAPRERAGPMPKDDGELRP